MGGTRSTDAATTGQKRTPNPGKAAEVAQDKAAAAAAAKTESDAAAKEAAAASPSKEKNTAPTAPDIVVGKRVYGAGNARHIDESVGGLQHMKAPAPRSTAPADEAAPSLLQQKRKLEPTPPPQGGSVTDSPESFVASQAEPQTGTEGDMPPPAPKKKVYGAARPPPDAMQHAAQAVDSQIGEESDMPPPPPKKKVYGAMRPPPSASRDS